MAIRNELLAKCRGCGKEVKPGEGFDLYLWVECEQCFDARNEKVDPANQVGYYEPRPNYYRRR